MSKLSRTIRFIICVAFYFVCSQPAFSQSCSWRAFDKYEVRTFLAYIGYYGRPADPQGLSFWADRLAQEGGGLDSIIQDFGTSQEFNDRFAHLNQGELITNIYLQLFDRQPDSDLFSNTHS